MKPNCTRSLLALGFVLLTLWTPARLTAQVPGDYSFSIHVGTFVKAELADFESIQPLGFIFAEKFQNQLLQVYLGEFASEAAANQLIGQVKAKGYPDAYITRRSLQQGERVYIIQLGNLRSGTAINWNSYAKAGPMYAYLQGQQLVPATGVFDNPAEAQQRLLIVQQLGFPDASVAPVNNIYLHDIGTFEAGGVLSPPQVELVVAAPATAPTTTPVATTPTTTTPPAPRTTSTASTPNNIPTPPSNTPATNAILVDVINTGTPTQTTPPPAEEIPTSYDDVLVARSPVATATPPPAATTATTATKSTTTPPPAPVAIPDRIAEPDIRVKVKRTSAFELQKVLKKEGTYRGSLDGFYGKGTTGGYTQIMAVHPEIQKYKMLSESPSTWQAKGGDATSEPFFDWESLRLLRTIAKDLDPNPAISSSLLGTYASVREELQREPQALRKEEQKAIIDWNTSLWKGLDTWATKDPVHQRMTTPLKISYYQSMVLLEDYFMDRKFQPLEAKGLALSVLQTIVAPYLESYRL